MSLHPYTGDEEAGIEGIPPHSVLALFTTAKAPVTLSGFAY